MVCLEFFSLGPGSLGIRKLFSGVRTLCRLDCIHASERGWVSRVFARLAFAYCSDETSLADIVEHGAPPFMSRAGRASDPPCNTPIAATLPRIGIRPSQKQIDDVQFTHARSSFPSRLVTLSPMSVVISPLKNTDYPRLDVLSLSPLARSVN